MILNLTTDNQFRLSTSASNYRLQYVSDESLIANTLSLSFIGSGNTTVTREGNTVIIFSSGGTGSTTVTANNGLTKSGDNIRLGGTLTGNTIIDTGNNNLLFDYGKQFNTGTTTVIRSTVGTTENVNNLIFRNNVSRSVVDGFGDVGLGFNNLNSGSTTSGGNIAIGQNNLNSVTPSGTFSASPWFSTFRGDRNISIGFNTGKALTGSGSNRATHNILMGSRVLETATDMSYNIFAGFQTAMNMNIPASSTNGQSNIGFGNYVMQNVTGGSASLNTSIGASVASTARQMGIESTLIGSGVARNITHIGNSNTAVGDSAIYDAAWTTLSNTFNTAVGASAFRNIVEGTNRSTAIGTSAGRYGGGNDNTYVGRAAGWTVRGTGNITLGFQSGHVSNNNYSAAAGTPYTGSNSTFIGYRSGYAITSNGVSNVIVIGSNYQPTLVAGNTYVNANNQIQLAITGNTKLTINNAGVIEYSSDVSDSYTNRSLVDKEYVDSVAGGSSFSIVEISASTTGTTTNNLLVVANSSSSPFSYYLPSSPINKQQIKIKDVSGNALINNVTVNGNGKNIDDDSTATIDTDYGCIEFTFIQSLNKWLITSFVV